MFTNDILNVLLLYDSFVVYVWWRVLKMKIVHSLPNIDPQPNQFLHKVIN